MSRYDGVVESGEIKSPPFATGNVKTISPIPDKLRVAMDTVLKKLEWPDQVTALAAAKRQLRTESCDFKARLPRYDFEAFFGISSFALE